MKTYAADKPPGLASADRSKTGCFHLLITAPPPLRRCGGCLKITCIAGKQYIGGEEVNTSPTNAHHRYMINFRDYRLRRGDVGGLWVDADAEKWRELRWQVVAPED